MDLENRPKLWSESIVNRRRSLEGYPEGLVMFLGFMRAEGGTVVACWKLSLRI